MLDKLRISQKQRFLMPRTYNRQKSEVLETLLVNSPGLRITYLDGLSEPHELIKKSLTILLNAYFMTIKMEFIPVGSTTRCSEAKEISFESDESYYLGTEKENLDLTIEVILTSGSSAKPAKYHRCQIPEAWLWENNQLQFYQLTTNNYKSVKNSVLLPKLDLTLLVRCAQMPSRLEAVKVFMAGVQHG